jgi:hypothetical protein
MTFLASKYCYTFSMFSRRNFLQLASSVGAGAPLPNLSDAVKSEVIAGISQIVRANKQLSADAVFCLHTNFGTVLSGVDDPKFCIYVGAALRSLAIGLKETPCLAIPFIDLYTRPHSDPILGSAANRDPQWPPNKVAEISDPPQFLLNPQISGHYKYAERCLKRYGVIANPETTARFIDLHNQYRSSLELALQSTEIANWISECPQHDVLGELHRMLGVHRGVSALVKKLKSALSDSPNGNEFMRDLTNSLLRGNYDQIINNPLILACERVSDFSSMPITPAAQSEQLQGAQHDLDYLSRHDIELNPEDSLRRQLKKLELGSESSPKITINQREVLPPYTPNGPLRTNKRSMIVSEIGATALNNNFSRVQSGYWVDKNGVYLVLPKRQGK